MTLQKVISVGTIRQEFVMNNIRKIHLKLYFQAILVFSTCLSQDIVKTVEFTGEIIAYIGLQNYYSAKDGKGFVALELPKGWGINSVNKEKMLREEKQKKEIEAINKVKDKILAQGNPYAFSTFDERYFTADPTAEYALQKEYKSSYKFYDNIQQDTLSGETYRTFGQKRIINIKTGDSIVFRIRDGDRGFSDIYSWSPDGKWFAIVSDDTISKKMSSSVLTINLITKEIKEYRIRKDIEDITWSPSSKEVAVLTRESKYQRIIWNLFLIPLGRPQEEYNYDLSIINVLNSEIITIPIVQRTKEFPRGLFWVK